MSDIIQSLWIGDRLSAMERLSIISFLRQAHEYHLYTYGQELAVPVGTVLRDAAEILPASAVFQYREHASYAGFANYFRYKLLLERGGWWVDTDMICLRPFRFPGPHVFSSEQGYDGPVPNCGAIRCPSGSPAMQHAWEVCQSRPPASLKWGETGPRLVAEAIATCGLEACVQPPETFCPVACKHWRLFLEENTSLTTLAEASSVHLWNELWRRNGCDKDATFPSGCFYEQLKRRYLPPQSEAMGGVDSPRD
jgi:hypothetical protein